MLVSPSRNSPRAKNGAASQWNSYIYATVAPGTCPVGVSACGTTPATSASVEAAATGTLVDNGDGTYQYTFKKDITKDARVVYDATLTHRVGFEIRNLVQANNGTYTFQPSSGATTGIFSREIVDTATCNNCHTSLTAHGGARVEVQYCSMCHNPGSTDPNSGNTLDLKVMPPQDPYRQHAAQHSNRERPEHDADPRPGLLDSRARELAVEFQYRALPPGHPQLPDVSRAGPPESD